MQLDIASEPTLRFAYTSCINLGLFLRFKNNVLSSDAYEPTVRIAPSGPKGLKRFRIQRFKFVIHIKYKCWEKGLKGLEFKPFIF